MRLRRARRHALLVAALGVAPTVPALGQDEGGPTSLLDAALSAWTLEGAAPESFTVGDGVLRVEGPEGWLKSSRRYGDFRLRIELRFLTEDADSGVFLRTAGDAAFIRGWPGESYQVQLRNPAGESPFPPVGGLFRHGMPDGATRFDPADAERLSAPTGVWQTIEIEAVGERLTVRLNGETLTEAEEIANASGFIGLQSEAGALEIRAMEIEEL